MPGTPPGSAAASNAALWPASAPTVGACADPDVLLAASVAEKLRQAAAELVPCLTRAALVLVRLEGWKILGWANPRDFARECIDRSPRWLRDMASLCLAMQRMPALHQAVTGADGQRALGRASAYEISRVATPETVTTWIARARNTTTRGLKELVRREREGAEGTRAEAGMHGRAAGRAPAIIDVSTPGFVATAWDDALEVYRAGNHGAPPSAFLEALIAESLSGVAVPGGELPVEAPEQPRRLCRIEMRRVLPEATGSAPRTSAPKQVLLALWTLRQVQKYIDADPDHPGLKKLEGSSRKRRLEATSRTRARRAMHTLQAATILERLLMTRLDDLLLWIDHRRAWSLLGYVDAAEFGRHVLDESPTTTRNRLRIARALEELPALRSAVEVGRLSHERLLRLVQLRRRRNLDEDEVRTWIAHVPDITVKRFDDELRRITRQRSTSGKCIPLSDKEWFDSLRLVPGRSRQDLLRAGLEAVASGKQPVSDVFLRLRANEETARDLRQCLNDARQNLAHRVDELKTLSAADEARTFPSVRLARIFVEKGQRLPDWLCLMAMLEEFLEQWDNPRAMPKDRYMAIRSRDGWRCTAPGCTARSIEAHHIEYRSHQGSDAPENLTSLCPFHHRMGEHGDLAKVTGKAPLGLRWRLGTGEDAQVYENERRVGSATPTRQAEDEARKGHRSPSVPYRNIPRIRSSSSF